MKELNMESYKSEVLDREGRSVVVFGTSWCSHCKDIVKYMLDSEKKYGDKILFFKVDIDDNEDMKEEHNIVGIPRVLFYKSGSSKPSRAGSLELEEFIKKCDRLLA